MKRQRHVSGQSEDHRGGRARPVRAVRHKHPNGGSVGEIEAAELRRGLCARAKNETDQ